MSSMQRDTTQPDEEVQDQEYPEMPESMKRLRELAEKARRKREPKGKPE
jgi:hypothetical protein